jgi:hypothetical protein
VQDPPPGTSFAYVKDLEEGAAATKKRREDSARRDPRARLEADGARQVSNLHTAFRAVLENALTRLNLDWANFRAEIRYVAERIARYGEFAGKPPTPEKALALEEVALAFNGLTNLGVSLDPTGANRFVADFDGSGNYPNLKFWVGNTKAMTALATMGTVARPFISRAAVGFTLASATAHLGPFLLEKTGVLTARHQPTHLETGRFAATQSLTPAAATVAV